MKKYVVLSLHQYAEGSLDDATLRERRLSELSGNYGNTGKPDSDRRSCHRRRNPVSRTVEGLKFMTAEQKKRVLRQWDKFIEGGFSFHLFTDAIYQHLNLHCGFIAHYDRLRFYSTYWNGDFITFARQTDMIYDRCQACS